MSTPIIAFANHKGGTGKSTITLQTAYYLAQRAGIPEGKKILVVDFDPQGNTSTRLTRLDDLEELGGTRTADLFNPDLEEVTPVMTQSGADLIYSLKNDLDLDDIELEDLAVFQHPQVHIRRLAQTGKYAAILLDCPPARSRKLIAALTAATHVIVPVEVSGFARDGLEGLIRSIEIARQINDDIQLTGVIINKYSSRSDRHRREKGRLEDALGDLLLPQNISFRTPIDEANCEAIPIWAMAKGSARTAAKEVKLVCEEIIRRTGIKLVKKSRK
ncbi:ParA family protein [Hydrocarboniclastica marina]|uniref:ParA family protein n=1 Tax=Hydrocarboniclastica marina TaxID=2259620 RepID=A0A4P7XLR5_9ALTE|nr:ParA family protein [Hydrocarboniclastica marina]QCF28121.1 ParA family protein [Hydrocarboniclastica marina]